MISGTVLFFSVSLFLYPFTYIIVLLKLIKDVILNTHLKRFKFIKLADMISFFLFGPFILLFQNFQDTIAFVLDLYNSNLEIKYMTKFLKINKQEDPLDPRFYTLFITFLRTFKVESIHSKKLIKSLSRSLQIERQIHNLLYLTEPERLVEK